MLDAIISILPWALVAAAAAAGLFALSRPRSISQDEYDAAKGRTAMLRPLLELQNTFDPGMKDLLDASAEIREERDDEGDPPGPVPRSRGPRRSSDRPLARRRSGRPGREGSP